MFLSPRWVHDITRLPTSGGCWTDRRNTSWEERRQAGRQAAEKYNCQRDGISWGLASDLTRDQLACLLSFSLIRGSLRTRAFPGNWSSLYCGLSVQPQILFCCFDCRTELRRLSYCHNWSNGFSEELGKESLLLEMAWTPPPLFRMDGLVNERMLLLNWKEGT